MAKIEKTLVRDGGDKRILEKWSILIEGAQGKRDQFYEEVFKWLEESQAPGVQAQPVLMKATFLGDERQYLRISNQYIKEYKMYIGATDYGINLGVYWYLTCEPLFWKRALSQSFGKESTALSLPLGIFEDQELNAYVTVGHHCVLKAVETLMGNLGQDTSKIDRKSKGFMGIS